MKLAAFILTTLIAAPVFTFAAPETFTLNNPARPQLPEVRIPASLPAAVVDASRQSAREFICSSVNYNDFIRVYLTFTSGTAGDIEVLQVDGYLPITFVHRPFSVKPGAAGALLVSEEDGDFRYKATLELPADYASLQEFKTPMVITRTSAGPIKSLLNCAARASAPERKISSGSAIASLRNKETCQYEAYDEGVAAFVENIGGIAGKSKEIAAGSQISDLEAEQIAAFLRDAFGSPDAGAAELINQTDDRMVELTPVVLPDGEQLTYYGAYGGDNAFGIFFKAGTTVVRGSNSDGAICINPK